MKLDTNPAPVPSPIVSRDTQDARSPPHVEGKTSAKDHLANKGPPPRSRTLDQETAPRIPNVDSAGGSRNSSQPSSPHIAHQYHDRGRTLSSELSPDPNRRKIHHTNTGSLNAASKEIQQDISVPDSRSRRNGEATQNGRFKLQEPPKSKKSEKRNSKGEDARRRGGSVTANNQVKEQEVTVPAQDSSDSSKSDATLSGSPKDGLSSNRTVASQDPYSSPLSSQSKHLPERGDSLAKLGQHPPRRVGESLGASKLSNATAASDAPFEKPASAPPMSTMMPPPPHGQRSNQKPSDSPSDSRFAAILQPPPRAKERFAVTEEDSSSDSFVATRPPPQPPQTRTRNESMRNGDYALSPKLPRYQDKDETNLDEDASRTAAHDSQQEAGGFLRRVSHSVRHARSYSDRGTRTPKEHKWPAPKSPMLGSPSVGYEISSPITSSPESRRDDTERLRKELEQERQRVSELEAALDAKSSIKQMNTELKEKRSTMVVLDTQKEIVVRELETLTEHIAAAKKGGEPFDVNKMSNSVLRQFAQSLQALKESFQPQIEELTQQRNDLANEVSKLDQQKGKSMQEFEQLAAKNTQLAELNNQLVHQISELYKANAGPALDSMRPMANGLGIHNAQLQKDKLAISNDGRDPRPSLTDSNLTGSTAVPDHDSEPATYLSAPQVVNIRKAQPKKFNWKKGGHNVAKGVTKGLKGAFSSDDKRSQRDGQFTTEGMPYGAMTQQEHPRTDAQSRNAQQERPGFGGFFGNPKTRPQQWKNSPNNSFPAVNADGTPRKSNRI